ncbi:MAG: hypothetical protein K2X87_03775 [Gemmataceae bacterium]|nr:hypothetical protein [Gemmataceae bacterium]
MTRVLLAAGPSLLVVDRNGVLYFRDRRRGDRPVPYLPEHYPVFLDTARRKHDMTPVIGLHGEQAPEIADGEWPELTAGSGPGGEPVFQCNTRTPARQVEPLVRVGN